MARTDSITDELIARYTELTGGAFSAAATPRGVLLPLVVTFAAQGRQSWVDERGARVRVPLLISADGTARGEVRWTEEPGVLYAILPLTAGGIDPAAAGAMIADLTAKTPISAGWSTVARYAQAPDGAVVLAMTIPLPGDHVIDAWNPTMVSSAIGFLERHLARILGA
jgi:hypothetical protein